MKQEHKILTQMQTLDLIFQLVHIFAHFYDAMERGLLPIRENYEDLKL